MARVAISVSCTDQDRRELERLSNSRTEEARLVERARIVMGCLVPASGMTRLPWSSISGRVRWVSGADALPQKV